MVSLEQVQLLETRVTKAIDYVQKITAENAILIADRETLQKKLDTYQKRIDELEVHIMRFKEDHSRIEDGIIAALDRLSQFEEAFESSLKDKTAKKSVKPKEKTTTEDTEASKEIFFEIHETETENLKTSDKGSSQSGESAKDEPLNDDLSTEGELDIF